MSLVNFTNVFNTFLYSLTHNERIFNCVGKFIILFKMQN